MAGNREGAMKAKQKMLERYGKDYYKEIGRRGGQKGTTGGFFANRQLASIAGKKGGTISRRGPSKNKV